jgi:FtsX-like permease family
MTAVGIRFRAELRARWRAWLVLALVAGLAGGLVITAFAGAARTDSALDRLLAVTRPQDVSIAKGFVFQNYDVDFDRIERLPQVVGVSRDRPLAALIRTASGEQMYGGHERSVIPLASPDGSQLTTLNRAQLRSGRRPGPRSADEILADEKALQLLGLDVGGTVRVRFIWRRLLGTNKVDFGADPERAVVGPIATLRIVGVISRTSSDDVSAELRIPPAVYRANGGSALGSFQEILNVRLRHGAADIPAFRTAVERIAGPGDFLFTAAAADRTKVGRSLDLQARALRLAGGFLAVAALILLTQALLRQNDHAAADHPTLRAIGMRRWQLVAVGLARAAVVAGGAAIVVVVTAIALSPLTPIGRARDLEPEPGIDVDGPALATGAAAILVAVLAAGALAALRAGPSRPSGRRSLGQLSLPPAMLAGLRPAAAAQATIVSATIAVAIVAAALVFSASLDRLLTTPRLYGQNWDYEAPFDPSVVPNLRNGIPEMPPGRWLGAAAVGLGSSLLIDGKHVGVMAFDDVKGHVPPTVVEGRAPRAPDEILLARETLDALGVRIGDSVEVRRGERAARMRVVGRGVLPEGEWIKFGEGAALTFEAFKRVVPDAILFFVHLRARAGAPRDASLAAFERHFDWPGPSRPSSIGDFGGVQGLPGLAALLVAAAAAGALAHALVTSVRHRRRELAILKTLGFVRGQVLAAVVWQSTIIVAIALLVGLPVGIAVGRFAWNVFAEDLGVLPESVVPIPATLVIVPAALVLANAIAAVPGLMAARTQPAVALRAE